MTHNTSAKAAGFTFLFYIAAGLTSMTLFNQAKGGEGTAARLASISDHTFIFGISIVLDLLCCLSAVVLAVTLYAITFSAGREIAMLGLACRFGEGIIGAANLPKTLSLLWLATASRESASLDAGSIDTIGTYLLLPSGSAKVSAIFFAFGSTFFAYLFIRGRLIPVWLAWTGIFASVLLDIILILQAGNFIKGGWLEWIPMLIFEIVLAVWLIVRGVPARNTGVDPLI